MRHILALASSCLLAGTSWAGAVSLSDRLIVGKWSCGPVTMHAPNAEIDVSSTAVNRADHTFDSSSTTVIRSPDKPAVSILSRARGTWQIAGDVIIRSLKEVQFVSSSDPTLGKAEGQAIEDAQLRKKSVYKARILQIDQHRSRSIPVDSMYKQAVVESTCRRV